MIAFLAQWLGESYSYQMGLSVIAFLETLSGVAVFIFPRSTSRSMSFVRRRGLP